MAQTNGFDDRPHHLGRDLDKFRPGAIVTEKNKLAASIHPDTEPPTAGGSTTFSRTPGLRVTLKNKSGKAREIALIEPPGKVGDFYDFGSILGRGGFGTVTEILHAKTFEPFAGKVIEKQSLQEINAEADKTFRSVMETFLNNEHTYVVRMLHIFEDESNYYQVMDSCHGGTLRRFVKNHEMINTDNVEYIAEQVCSGLAFLHGMHIVHRDIKPDNVMLVGGPGIGDENALGTRRIKLNIVDFDMCIFMDEKSEASTGHIEGTPGYLAPEVLSTRKYSPMSDLFSLGCLMFFVLRREEPGTHAGFDSLPTLELVEGVNRWTAETIDFCNSIDPDVPTPCISPTKVIEDAVLSGAKFTSGNRSLLPSRPTSPGGSEVPTPSSPTSPLSPVSAHTPQEPGAMFNEIPVRLWRLMAWCVQQDPALRPQLAEEVLKSGLIRDEPSSPCSPEVMSPKERKKMKKDKKDKKSGVGGTASISDLLKLG